MQPLPYYDFYADEFPHSKLMWLVVVIYISVALFSLQLLLAIYNSYRYLYQQSKYKKLPLLLFYVLTILLTVVRIWYSIFFFGFIMYQYVIAVIMPILYINMGLNQCWMLFELSLRVRRSLWISESRASFVQVNQLETSLLHTENII